MIPLVAATINYTYATGIFLQKIRGDIDRCYCLCRNHRSGIVYNPLKSGKKEQVQLSKYDICDTASDMQAGRPTDRQTDRQADRQTDRPLVRGKQTDRPTDTQTDEISIP